MTLPPQYLPPQYSNAERLEALLCAVFRASDAPAPAARMKFLIEPPGACVVVGGGPESLLPGQLLPEHLLPEHLLPEHLLPEHLLPEPLLLSGPEAHAAAAELTFTLTPETAHAMWSGNFNALAALAGGGLRIAGSPALALRLGGGLAPVQRAYRAELGLG